MFSMEYSVVLFEQKKSSREIIKMYFEESTSFCLNKIFEDYSEGYDYIKSEKPDFVIINTTKKTETCLELVKQISDLGIKVIIISSDFTASNVIKSLRSGASDFLPIPVIKDDLFSTLEKLTTTQNNSETKCRILTVFSNKGGIGKTAIASNLAVELARITKEKTALLDLNFQLGDISTFLDLKPTFDVSYVLNNKAPKDENFLLSTFEKYKDLNLYILSEPAFAEKSKSITPSQIISLLNAVRKTFSFVIIDMGTIIDEKSQAILDNSDIIFLTAIINLPSIRNCQRCLELFDQMGYSKSKTQIIINRYVENDEIKIEEVEKALDKEIYWKIPNNYFTIMSAINKGVPVSDINYESNLTTSFRELAITLSDSIIEQNIAERVKQNKE